MLQALAGLQREGRVEMRRGRRAVVAPPGPRELDACRAELWWERSVILQKLALSEMLQIGTAFAWRSKACRTDRSTRSEAAARGHRATDSASGSGSVAGPNATRRRPRGSPRHRQPVPSKP